MTDDFHRLIEEIEAEAKAEGTDAELRDMRREFSIASQLMNPPVRREVDAEVARPSFRNPPERISRIETGEANPTYAHAVCARRPSGVQVGLIVPDAA